MRRPSATVASLVAVLITAPTLVARADTTDACIASAESAQHLRRDGRLRASRDALIACARDACPDAIADDCKRWLAEVERSIPTLVVRVRDAGGADVTDARVLVDGALAAARVDGRALPVDPGEHTVRVERDGAPAVGARVLVASGERDRLVELTIPREPIARRAIPAAAWAIGGAGVAALGIGTFLWAVGRSDRADLYASCGVTRLCTADDRDRAQRKLLLGDVAFAAGLAAIGAAAWIAIAPHPSSNAPRVGVAPLSGGGAWLGYDAAF